MMLLDTEDIIKRISLVLSALAITGSIGAAIWYNSNLKVEFDQGKTETNYLRQETSRLGAMTDSIKEEVEIRAKELKNNILSTKEETVKVDKEVKLVQQDNEKLKLETKTMNTQLVELIKLKDQEVKTIFDKLFKEQEKFKTDTKNEFEKLQNNDQKIIRDIVEYNQRLEFEIAKLKDMNTVFSAMMRQRDKEIEELSRKLEKEIEWRSKYYPFNR